MRPLYPNARGHVGLEVAVAKSAPDGHIAYPDVVGRVCNPPQRFG